MLSLSMTIWGTLGLFTRQIPVSSGELALYRALLAIAVIGAYLLVFKQKLDMRKVKRELLLLLLSGMAMGINWVLLFEAYRYTSVSLATLCYYFAPVIVMVACPFLFREKLTKKQILCFIGSTVGLCLIIGIGGAGGGSDGNGILFGLGAALFYASVVLMNKYIKELTGVHRTFMQFIGAIIILIPYTLLTDGIHPEALDPKGFVCLLVVGIIHTGIPYCLYFSSLKALSGQNAAILSYIDPLVAVIVSVTILSEGISPLQLVGGALILGFTLYNEI